MSPEIHETGPGLPSFARFGAGSKIYAPFIISCANRIYIGENVHISPGAYMSVVDEYLGRRYDPHLIIGDGAIIGGYIIFACVGRIEIGARVGIADKVYIGDTYHDYHDPHTAIMDQPMADPKPVKIGDGAFVGVNSVVLPGVTIGERACVGGNTVVSTDVPPNTLFAGNPGRVIKHWDPNEERWVSTGPEAPAPPPAPRVEGAVAELEHRVSLAEQQRLARDDEVNALQQRLDELQGQLEDAQRARQNAEYWLQDHRSSLSWRLTSPLRRAKRSAVSSRRRGR